MVKYNIQNAIKNAVGKEKKRLIKVKKEEDDWIQSINQMLTKAGIVVSTPNMSWIDITEKEEKVEKVEKVKEIKKTQKDSKSTNKSVNKEVIKSSLKQNDNHLKVVVKQLRPDTTRSDLISIFGRIGRIKVFILTDKETQKCKGTAFITFENKNQVEQAKNLDGTKLKNKIICVEYAK